MRKFPRFETREKVRLDVGDRDEMRVLWTQDVSCGGLFVQTDSPPAFGSRVRVSFDTPDGSIDLSAEVVHVLTQDIAEQFGRSPGVGLQFVDLSERQRSAIERYVDGIAERLTQELEPSEVQPEEVIELARGVLRDFEANDLYTALDVDPRASPSEIQRCTASVIKRLELCPSELSPAQVARVERALGLVKKIRALLLDPSRRLDYDLRRDLVYARERLAEASADEAEALRTTWCEIHPDRIDEAEKHAADALRFEQQLDLTHALEAGAAALRCDPFNRPLRATLKRWRQVLDARESDAAPPSAHAGSESH